MNWSGIMVALGAVAIAVATFPFGLAVIPLAVWLWRRS